MKKLMMAVVAYHTAVGRRAAVAMMCACAALGLFGDTLNVPSTDYPDIATAVAAAKSGEKGMLTCDCFGPNVYHNGAPNDRYTVQYTYFDEWIGLIDEFVGCIRNHTQPTINLKWHKETIQSMLGCYESIQTGKIAKIR